MKKGRLKEIKKTVKKIVLYAQICIRVQLPRFYGVPDDR